MTQEAVQLELMASGSGLPANIDAYRSDVFRDLPQREALLQAIEQGAAFPLHPDLPLALRQHALDLDKLMNGEWTEEAELLFRRHPVKPADVAANALNRLPEVRHLRQVLIEGERAGRIGGGRVADLRREAIDHLREAGGCPRIAGAAHGGDIALSATASLITAA